MLEVRQNAETERQKCIAEVKKQFEADKQKLVNDTKKKQWCAQCGKEAIFYCCWNTSYCDYPCQVQNLKIKHHISAERAKIKIYFQTQQKHWPSHMITCAQNQGNQDEDTASASANDGHMEAIEHSGAASHFLGQAMKVREGWLSFLEKWVWIFHWRF